MPTKTYQAENMMQALQLVQQEMGPEAIVLSVRDLPQGQNWQVWRKTGVEVVAATPDMLAQMGVAGAADAAGAEVERRGETVVRRSGAGIAFREEMPEIEWEAAAITTRDAEKGKPAAPKHGAGKTISKPVWQTAPARQTAPEQPDLAALFRGQLAAAESRVTAAKPPADFAPARKPAQPRGDSIPEIFQNVMQPLYRQGVEPGFLEWLAQTAAERMPEEDRTEAGCRAFLCRLMEAELVVPPDLTAETNTLVLVGASGSGKTSTLAKLAFYYSSVLGRRVTWVGADTLRTGAVAETRAYTGALGLPLKLVYTAGDFHDICANRGEDDMLLVDLPGYNPYSEAQMVELGSVLTEIPERTTYLVVSATTRDVDMQQATAALGLYTLNGWIATKMDETMTYGSVYNLARQSRLPLVFITNGKDASENLHIAEPRKLVRALFRKGWTR